MLVHVDQDTTGLRHWLFDLCCAAASRGGSPFRRTHKHTNTQTHKHGNKHTRNYVHTHACGSAHTRTHNHAHAQTHTHGNKDGQLPCCAAVCLQWGGGVVLAMCFSIDECPKNWLSDNALSQYVLIRRSPPPLPPSRVSGSEGEGVSELCRGMVRVVRSNQ